MMDGKKWKVGRQQGDNWRGNQTTQVMSENPSEVEAKEQRGTRKAIKATKKLITESMIGKGALKRQQRTV